jgi:hypothetical protein
VYVVPLYGVGQIIHRLTVLPKWTLTPAAT